jgi:hypothetical protein
VLLGDMPDDDPWHGDLQEINRSARALIVLFRRDVRT